MPKEKDLEYYIAQVRKIEEHRDKGVEAKIRKTYKEILKDLRHFIADEYVRMAEDGELTYEVLHAKGEYARFLEEVEQRVNNISPKVSAEIKTTVEETYKLAYQGLVDAVEKSGTAEGLRENLNGVRAITPETVKRAVENPISGLTLNDTLEKNRKEIIWNIKRQIGIGLTQGDRMTTMAKRVSENLDNDYKKAIRIVRTETHRVREAGRHDAATEVDEALKQGTTGMRMVKTWKTKKDERVRPSYRYKTRKGWKFGRSKNGADHQKMDGVTILADEYFDLGGGVKTLKPSNSGDAKNDINCRCHVSYDMMTDEEFFKATGRHFVES